MLGVLSNLESEKSEKVAAAAGYVIDQDKH